MLGLAGCGAAMAADNVSQSAAGPAGLATAASWRIVKTIKGTSSGSPSFTAITATSAHDAWAFESTSAKPVAWRLTGSAWQRVAFPGRIGDTVTAAGASSPDNAWAFTSVFGGSSRAIAWNGARWTVAHHFSQAIGGTLVLGRHDVWAFGGGTWHFNGTSWTRYPSVPTLTAASALSASSIWAVGGTVAAYWNGRAWSKMSLARVLPRPAQLCPQPSADGVYAQSPRDVWVVGAANCQDERGPFVMLHYDGKQWRRVALLSRYGGPTALVPDGFGGLWIATIAGFPGDFTMLHYTDGHLRVATMPLPSSRIRVNALAHVPHTALTLGGGASFATVNPGLNPSAIILRYGG